MIDPREGWAVTLTMSNPGKHPLRVAHILDEQARVRPLAPALWSNGRPVSYRALARMRDAALALLKDEGIVAGDRVMVVAENCVAQIALFFAAGAMGAWPVLVNARLSGRELLAIRDHSGPRLVLVVPAAGEAADRAVAVLGAGERVVHELGRLAVTHGSRGVGPEAEPMSSQVAALIYTSGTTGAPKGVMVTHRGLLHFAARSAEVRGLHCDDIVFGALPMSHIFGLATILLTTFYAGASVWLMPRFDAAAACAALAAFDVSVLHGVPTLYARLLEHLAKLASPPAFPALRYAYAGGGALDPQLKCRVEAALGLPLHHGYGMTEYAGSMFVTHIDRPRADVLPGELNPDCEVRFVDEDGRDVAPRTAGEIWIRGPGTMLGYYRAPELTGEVLVADGWLKTGDIGYLADDGALCIAGRSRELIKRSGFTVYPLEVEAELASYPPVHQAAVIGVPAGDGDERVIAFVVPRAGAIVDVGELTEHARARLSGYKVPQQIIVVAQLPLTVNGKVRKRELRAQHIGIKTE